MISKALIFDIQKGSFTDGPGIRTVVYFKGCNLNCAWCHNPEGINKKKQMMFYKNKCISCGNCAKVCTNPSCTLCGKCVGFCPVNARKICGTEYDVASLLNIVKADKPFYDNSGGGVTCTGGECMLQIDFLEIFLQKCTNYGIHTAVDTAGHVSWEYFERILPYTNLFLYDIKAINNDIHNKFTGAGNSLILKNFERLAGLCPERVSVRIPVIPDANECEKKFIFEYLAKFNIPIEFLPYHKLGEGKAEALINKA